MKGLWSAGGACCVVGLLVACNSDVPVSASTIVEPLGWRVTITRVATHPFLARYNLTLTVDVPPHCSASSQLFPDTGGVSRRNLYRATSRRLYVVGQFDMRVFDTQTCAIMLMEFRSVEPSLVYLGVFDVGQENQWTFLAATVRPERLFEQL